MTFIMTSNDNVVPCYKHTILIVILLNMFIRE